nr:integrase, catalytic region, zinc finger, CCHC-type, peptidase aspartic, catalytic [Tanacetum cinerariifolium]
MKSLKEKVEDKLIKQDQSLQTVHMLCRPKPHYNELNNIAIGYKNPLYLTCAKQVQHSLYNGHEIIKENHAPAIAHNTKDTLEIAEITRKKMNAKMNDPECVTRKVKIAPHDYSKENFLATFTPQKQLTLEQIFWSNDLMKLKSEALKERTKVSRPIKAFTVYRPNTPATLVPKVLPTKCQVTKLTTDNVNLKTSVSKDQVKPQVLAQETHAIDVEPIVSRLRNNRDAHLDYLRHLKESVETICDIVEEANLVRPLDRSIVSACRYTKHSQELLEYMIGTCPQGSQQQAKQLTYIPLIRKKQVAVAKPSGCSKHMTGDRSRLMNFVKKFIGTVRFGNDHYGAIMGYGDYVFGNSVISRVYYVKGLGHNLFFVRQFCDSDLEIAFQKHSCYVRDTNGVELIKSSRGSNLYTILIEDMLKSSPICLFSKASKNKSWLWHRCLNHLNFGTINDLARKDLVRGLPRLKFEKDHLCSAYETPDVVIKFITQIQDGLNKPIRYVRTDNGTEFVNHTMTEYYERIGIFHQKTVPRTLQQDGFVERRNRTLVEATQTMLIFSKALMFLWAEAVHNKKPDLTFFRVFGALCYPTNENEDLGKLQLTADTGIFVGYAPSKKRYRIYNKRTRRIMETIHVQFDELTEPMAPMHLATGPAFNFLMPGHISSGLVPNSVPATPYAPPTNKELEILFQLMFDKYLEPPRAERPVSPAQAEQALVNSAGTPSSTTIDQDAPTPSISPSSSALQSHSLHQGVAAEPNFMEDHTIAPVDNNPFVNVFALEPQSKASTSGDISSTKSPYVSQTLHHLNKWSKDHPLDNVIGNPSRPVSNRKQLAIDALWCLYSSVLSKVEPKNFKSAITEDCWFQAMQDEIYEFDRLQNLRPGNFFEEKKFIERRINPQSSKKHEIWPASYLEQHESPPPLHVNPLSGSTTYSSFPNQLLEEFTDELALEYDDDLQFDIESNLKEIKYLLHHDPIKDIDSILKDSIDQSNLADLN